MNRKMFFFFSILQVLVDENSYLVFYFLTPSIFSNVIETIKSVEWNFLRIQFFTPLPSRSDNSRRFFREMKTNLRKLLREFLLR